MALSTILILPASIKSHVLPSLSLAEKLRSVYEIHYAVTDDMLATMIRLHQYDATIISRYKVGLGMEDRYLFEVRSVTSKWRILKCILNNDLLKYRQDELRALVDRIQPEAVFIDIFNSTDMLALYPIYHGKIKLLFFNPMLSTYRVNGFPTVSQANWPNCDGDTQPKSVKKSIPLHVALQNPIDFMIAKALDRQFSQLTRNGGFANNHPKAMDITSALLFDNVPEVILAPLELEVSPKVRKPTQHYLGLCIHETREDIELDDTFEASFKEIVELIKAGQKLVYCTFGTFYQGSDKSLVDFLNKLIDALEGITEIQAVFAVNKLVIQTLKHQRKIPKTMHFFTKVPQLQVLRHADVYVTHGGLGSVKESIYYGVPMLVYPLDLVYDQNGNGLKVEYHGLGLRGVFLHERTKDMYLKIRQLLDDPVYKETISLFRDKCIRNDYAPQLLADLITKIPRQ